MQPFRNLTTTWAGRPLYFYEEIDSTNLRAKQEAENGATQGTLIVADMQTAGRGRSGRTWNSPAGANLYFTLVLRPEYEITKASMMTLVMALAVAGGIVNTVQAATEPLTDVAAIGSVTEPEIAIKWPNDIVINGKKVCGILTELCVEQGKIKYAVIGVGVNVGRQEFPPELAATATSLECELTTQKSGAEKQIPKMDTLRAELLENILQAFEEKYETFCHGENFSGLMEEYNRLLVNRGREVRVLDPKGEYTGLCKGINEKGELLVERPGGSVEAVYAGEVSVRGIYGYV